MAELEYSTKTLVLPRDPKCLEWILKDCKSITKSYKLCRVKVVPGLCKVSGVEKKYWMVTGRSYRLEMSGTSKEVKRVYKKLKRSVERTFPDYRQYKFVMLPKKFKVLGEERKSDMCKVSANSLIDTRLRKWRRLEKVLDCVMVPVSSVESPIIYITCKKSSVIFQKSAVVREIMKIRKLTRKIVTCAEDPDEIETAKKELKEMKKLIEEICIDVELTKNSIVFSVTYVHYQMFRDAVKNYVKFPILFEHPMDPEKYSVFKRVF